MNPATLQPKKSNRKPSTRQRKAAKDVVLNELSDKPLPLGEVLAKVGYGTIVQDPQRITKSDGFQTALQELGLKEALEAQGINPQKIAEKIDVLLEAKKVTYRRNEYGDLEENGIEIDFTAVDKGLKHATAIYGIVPDKPPETKNIYNFIFNPDVQDQVDAINENIKNLLTRKHVE